MNPVIDFSLGCNFDPKLIDCVAALNETYGQTRRIAEFFGALPESPINSARPEARIPKLSWESFASQVIRLSGYGIGFNYLFNTQKPVSRINISSLYSFIDRLAGIGVLEFTMGTPDQIELVKNKFPELHLTLSLTYGCATTNDLRAVEECGADSVYFDATKVNRNFTLLRELVRYSSIQTRLYANVSCISACPVISNHYKLFSGNQDTDTAERNDAFFAGCSLVKLGNPVEWLQMPWIRPEDIGEYVRQGVFHFKLSDRLAPTEVLLRIAETYLSGKSPENLATIIERNGNKFVKSSKPKWSDSNLVVLSDCIPLNFIDHFSNGSCTSSNVDCAYCCAVAEKAVLAEATEGFRVSPKLASKIPTELLRRAAFPPKGKRPRVKSL